MVEIEPLNRRLKGLDEFETPEFVGRMERVQRRQRFVWYSMLVGATALGAAIGLLVL